MKIRPSALPMLQKCPLFESSSDASEFASSGTARHAYLTSLFSDKIPTAETRLNSANGASAQAQPAPIVGSVVKQKQVAPKLSDEEIEAVEWAAEYIRVHAPMNDHPIDFERRLTLTDSDFNEVFAGTPDCVCGAELFDLKWRRRDYTAQMAAYALMMFENNPALESVRVHVLYGESKWAETFNISQEIAHKCVFKIIENKSQTPRANEFCGWCANRLWCAAFTDRVNEVVSGREDWKLTNYHTSQIDTPEQMSKALTIARVLKKWIEAVEFHAEKMIEKGVELPGYIVKERKGRTFCNDVSAAFSLAGISQEQFLKCCDLRMNTSKEYPDRVGLIDAVQKSKGGVKAAAKRELMAKLAPVLTTGKSSKSLVAIAEQLTGGQSQISE